MATTTKKMTYVDALNAAINVTEGEVQEKLVQLRDVTIRRNSAERKPTKKQVEQHEKDAEYRSDILSAMQPDTLYSADEIAKTLIPGADVNSHKVTFLMKDLVATSKVVKVVDKRKTYYKLP
jgi:hypothetical protein